MQASHELPGPSAIARFFLQEDLNFLVTNRIPRRMITLAAGRLASVESRTFARAAIAIWRLFAHDLDLSEAKERDFTSLQRCFVRELKHGARPVARDPDVLVSPCDAEVGASGRIEGTRVYQAKGFPYSLEELLGDRASAERWRDGFYVTLRLRSSFYHRFHAPDDGRLQRVTYVSGDTWNVNPIALRRVERLFCRNERAILEVALERPGEELALVAVASILVASLKLHALPEVLDLRYRGPNVFLRDDVIERGQELGYFQSGSTIVLLARGPFDFAPSVHEGAVVRVGRPLLRRVTAPRSEPTPQSTRTP